MTKELGSDLEPLDVELSDLPQELRWREWMHRTRSQYSNAIHTAADINEKGMSFTETEMTVLATIAYHQPISRAGLGELFGHEVSRDLISRLQFKKLIGLGPRAPQRGALFTYVTTVEFLAMFDLQSLRELPTQVDAEV